MNYFLRRIREGWWIHSFEILHLGVGDHQPRQFTLDANVCQMRAYILHVDRQRAWFCDIFRYKKKRTFRIVVYTLDSWIIQECASLFAFWEYTRSRMCYKYTSRDRYTEFATASRAIRTHEPSRNKTHEADKVSCWMRDISVLLNGAVLFFMRYHKFPLHMKSLENIFL